MGIRSHIARVELRRDTINYFLVIYTKVQLVKGVPEYLFVFGVDISLVSGI